MGQRRTEVDRGGQRLTESDRGGQRRTEADRGGQRRTAADRGGQRRTEADRGGQRRTAADRGGQRRTVADSGGHMADMWRTYGGHVADIWQTCGGHMANMWRTKNVLYIKIHFHAWQMYEAKTSERGLCWHFSALLVVKKSFFPKTEKIRVVTERPNRITRYKIRYFFFSHYSKLVFSLSSTYVCNEISLLIIFQIFCDQQHWSFFSPLYKHTCT
jgi:hypothetical protein